MEKLYTPVVKNNDVVQEKSPGKGAQLQAKPFDFKPTKTDETQPEQQFNPLGENVSHKATGLTVQRRKGNGVDKAVWLTAIGLRGNYVSERLLENYMNDEGKEYILTKQEMKDIKPVGFGVSLSDGFNNLISELRKNGGAGMSVQLKQPSAALTIGTLGSFTIIYNGELKVDAKGHWQFKGTMQFEDTYNFNPHWFSKDSRRSIVGEIRTIVGHVFIPGRGYKVSSEKVNADMTSKDDPFLSNLE